MKAYMSTPVDAHGGAQRRQIPDEEEGIQPEPPQLQLQLPIKLLDLLYCCMGGVEASVETSAYEVPSPKGDPSAEITLLWPPCMGCQEHSVIEVQVGITRTVATNLATPVAALAAVPQLGSAAAAPPASPPPAQHSRQHPDILLGCATAAPGTKNGGSSSSGGLAVHAAGNVLSPAPPFAKHRAHLLTVAKDSVTAAEPLSLVGRRVLSRVRVYERDPSVISFIMADGKGFPSCETIKNAALLPVLPPQACHEMQGLLWSMLQESLPPGSDLPPYDPEAFSSPLSSLPTPLQQAASWAWGNHFRHLAADLNYCLDCMPEPGSEQEHDFRAVLCSMVAYLRDHNAWATLACLLASCAARGCVLLSAHATSPLSPEDLSPESVAALSGNAAACQCHAGAPCSCCSARPPTCLSPPAFPASSSTLDLPSALSSPPTSPAYASHSSSTSLPHSPLAAPAGSSLLRPLGYHTPKATRLSPFSNRCLATYLHTTCDGMGVWVDRAGQAGARGVRAGGKLGRGQGTGLQRVLAAGMVVAMLAAWLVLVLPVCAASSRGGA